MISRLFYFEALAKLLRQPPPASNIRSQCSLESVYAPLCPQFLPFQELRQEFYKHLVFLSGRETSQVRRLRLLENRRRADVAHCLH